ncbi:hypothetical protein PSDVSF_05390 [Pseudodesulfovibrio sediminis]|uniref:Uncharacterized protein n=1 Tax=Pseudodesulfovibrio sediminis TaxID=2810563 RepID=A0ABN6EMM0_9BACT|nr:hypothetical protein PSDVSF_05390 [Pseudodesulfovibrio sediminis]
MDAREPQVPGALGKWPIGPIVARAVDKVSSGDLGVIESYPVVR